MDQPGRVGHLDGPRRAAGIEHDEPGIGARRRQRAHLVCRQRALLEREAHHPSAKRGEPRQGSRRDKKLIGRERRARAARSHLCAVDIHTNPRSVRYRSKEAPALARRCCADDFGCSVPVSRAPVRHLQVGSRARSSDAARQLRPVADVARFDPAVERPKRLTPDAPPHAWKGTRVAVTALREIQIERPERGRGGDERQGCPDRENNANPCVHGRNDPPVSGQPRPTLR